MTAEMDVPWVAAWSAEQAHTGKVWWDRGMVRSTILDATGLFHWMPTPDLQGQGRPIYGQVHPLRQSRCMRGKRCQVCGQKMTVATWILPSAAEGDFEATSIYTPPTCEPCIEKALVQCPHLRRGTHSLIYRVPRFHLAGVYGSIYRDIFNHQDDYVELSDIDTLARTIAKDLVVQWDEWEAVA